MTAAAGFTIIPRHVLGRGMIAPSDKIQIGFIGLGKQSNGLSRRFIDMTEAQIVAGCDVWSTKREWFAQHANQLYAQQRGQLSFDGIFTCENYEELVSRNDVDGVVIATPDHWHAIQAIAAMKQGKDVYCEKPLTHTVHEGKMMVNVARETGRIVQTGSMQRSDQKFRKACELVRNGYLGTISKALVNVGNPSKSYDLQKEEIPKEVDWNRWCGPAPLLPYNHRLAPSSNDVRFWPDWRLFKETGGGILCDWGAHMFDIAQWGLGMDRSGPSSLIPPTHPHASRGLKMIYENGIEMLHWNFGRGWAVRFIGSEGTLDVSRGFLDSDPGEIVTAQLKEGEMRLYDTGGNHYLDWINAMKTRIHPVCDVETGHRSATVCNLANIAYHLNRPLNWDPEKESFVGDEVANQLLTKKYRSGFELAAQG